MIYTEIDFYGFRDAFRRRGREENFPNTLQNLFDYVNELS